MYVCMLFVALQGQLFFACYFLKTSARTLKSLLVATHELTIRQSKNLKVDRNILFLLLFTQENTSKPAPSIGN